MSRSDSVSLAGAFKPRMMFVKEVVVALATIEWTRTEARRATMK